MALTKEDAMKAILKAQKDDDTEEAHCRADDALCGYLEHLGHADLVEEYHKVSKWFA